MTTSFAAVPVDLRIPGQWLHPSELIERLPADYRFTPAGFVLPDNTRIGFGAVDADSQFAGIFRASCRRPPTEQERAMVDDYTVNVLLRCPGGSLSAARTIMQVGAAMVRAGGAGVFIDNSALAHGGEHWLELAADGGTDALSFAFVAIVGGQTEVWTIGMHVLGLRDILMQRKDADKYDIIEVIRYLVRGEKPLDDGHVLADPDGPRFRAFVQDSPPGQANSPMFNPLGRLKLVSLRDIAETN